MSFLRHDGCGPFVIAREHAVVYYATAMSFSEVAFQTRLDALTTSQDSIETMSLWMQHHRKHAPQVVAVWLKQMKDGALH